MAEIDIKRKERSVWPWVLIGIILLALLAWWVMSRRDRDPDAGVFPADTAQVGTTAAPTATADGAVGEFVRYSDEGRARGEMGVTHEYTATGIRRLAAALEDIANRQQTRDAMVSDRIPMLRNLADSLQATEDSPRHANHARSAFTIGADIITALRRDDAGATDAARRAREAAESIQPTTPLLQQRRQVREFFDRAADALRDLTGRTT